VCRVCGEVMMCSCDREFGEEFLPHQLHHGRDLETGLDVDVTLGFQDDICRECRGLPPEAHPKAELYGRSSKVVRYYWREIFFETTRRFGDWAKASGLKRVKARFEHRNSYDKIEREVIDEIKEAHARVPKYDYSEPSAAEIIGRYGVETVDLRAQYLRDGSGGRHLVTSFGTFQTPEEAASAHYRNRGYNVMKCESRPFHVLFGTFMWLVIQDPSDELRQMVGFGSRTAFEAGENPKQILTFLPKDFGKPGYATRRAEALDEHFALLEDDLGWLFDYWLEPSVELRQYLWAHRDEDVERARRVLEIIAPEDVRRVLRYLVDSYWGHYVGWPDLLVCDSQSFLFCEVKGSGDSLSSDQKRWITDNAEVLGFPFELLKIHRAHESL
jgi:hypothetical protein